MTCLAPPTTQGDFSVSAEANGQHHVFRITVDGVPLPDPNQTASKDQPKTKFDKVACAFIS